MKRITCLLLIALTSCGGDDSNESKISGVDFREEMRQFVIGISVFAKAQSTDFLIIPQNGIELVTNSGDPKSSKSSDYLAAIDGHGQEDLLYGYDSDDKASPPSETDYLTDLLNVSLNAGNVILVTDYCSTPSKVDDSYSRNQSAGYISFAADDRELSTIPNYPSPVHYENDASITDLSDVKNFLYLINPSSYPSKAGFISAVKATNYDLLIMDLYFDDISFSATEIEELKNKANGGKRLVVSYMSIGEAEDYRYYWNTDWSSNKPEWIEKENPDWEGNYKVRYWESDWQDIIYGNSASYLQKILDAGFDGVYLDIIDGYEYFE